MKQVIFIILILLMYSGAKTQNTDETIFRFQNLESVRNAGWSIFIKDLKKDEILLKVNVDQSLIPASTLKVLTTGFSLRELGPKFRFKTVLGHTGVIKNGVLNGDLIVKSGADPTFAYSDFHKENPIDSWVELLDSLNIESISGKIVIDNSEYSHIHAPSTWVYQDLGNYYGAVPSGLSYMNNQFSISFGQNPQEGGETTLLKDQYPASELTIENKVVSGPKGSGDNAYVYGCPGCNAYTIRGSIPPGVGTFTIKASIPDPPKWFLNQFSTKLRNKNIEYSGSVVMDKPLETQIKPLDTIYSPNLLEILNEVNVNSNNLYAEHLRMSLETRFDQNYDDLSKKFYSNMKLEAKGLFIEDGSGLSRYNSLTTKNQVDFLEAMYQSELFDNYLSTFAIGGENGTVKDIFKSAKGTQYFVKSGSLSRVKAYCGYAKKQDGSIYTFSVIINNYTGSSPEMSFELEKLIISNID